MSINKSKNFFKTPHRFEEIYGDKINPSVKYFFIILLKLENRFANKCNWFWHIDKEFKTKRGDILGFESFGFSISASKRARRKLKELNLIEIRYGFNKVGHRMGTFYKLNHEKFDGA